MKKLMTLMLGLSLAFTTVAVVFADDASSQLAVAGRADDERDVRGQQESEAGAQIIEHDDVLAGIGQRVHHMASDVTGAARHQDRHAKTLCCHANAQRQT